MASVEPLQRLIEIQVLDTIECRIKQQLDVGIGENLTQHYVQKLGIKVEHVLAQLFPNKTDTAQYKILSYGGSPGPFSPLEAAEYVRKRQVEELVNRKLAPV